MGVGRPLDITQTSAKPSYRCSTNTTAWARTVGARRFPVGPTSASTVSLDAFPLVLRKKEDRVLTGRQPWELRSCELVFASV